MIRFALTLRIFSFLRLTFFGFRRSPLEIIYLINCLNDIVYYTMAS